AEQFLTMGNGSATTFTLQNSNIVSSSVKVFVVNTSSQSVVHGQQNGQDPVGYYDYFISVSNTSGGPANYTQGVDWRHTGQYTNNLIDWSLGSANQPAVGSTYFVTYANMLGVAGNPASFTLSGNQITLTKAPTSNQAVFVEYVYGTHSADGSTLAYQQTS